MGDRFEGRVKTGEQVNPGVDHGRGMDKRADWRRCFHGIWQPGLEWELRGFGSRRDEETERQQRDEAMESAFDWIFSNPAQQILFETALLQIWATYRCQEDSPMSRLANVIDYGMTAFASHKAKEKYQ